jgi:hypothetical protein
MTAKARYSPGDGIINKTQKRRPLRKRQSNASTAGYAVMRVVRED